MADRLNELLAELQRASGCPYLSDLHFDYKNMSATSQGLIFSIPDDRYPLEVWNRAVAYITGDKAESNNIIEAKSKFSQDR